MSNMRLTGDFVRQRLASLSMSSGPDSHSDIDLAYRKAASVLTYFEPESLKPLGHEADPEALKRLLDESTLVRDKSRALRWMLSDHARMKTLEQMEGPQEFQLALDANSERSEDLLQRTVDAYVRGSPDSVSEQSLDELLATQQVVRWFGSVLPNLPASDEIERRVGMETLLEPFRLLVRDGFVGRSRDLARLSDYVGVLPPSSALRSIQRFVEERLSLVDKPPLVIWGPGGMGKSTMLARFVLEHVELDEEDRIPFICLNFDRPQLKIEEPLTLVLESVRQIGIQVPQGREPMLRLAERIQTAIGSTHYQETQESAADEREGSLRADLVREFAELLQQVTPSNRPLLLVLDTFEEAQYHGARFLKDLWAFLEQLQERVPRLRVVVSGRTPVEEFEKSDEHPLAPLSKREAQDLVQHWMGAGVDDKLVKAIVDQAGGNPLSLKLAAGVVSKRGVKGIEGLRSWRHLQMPWKSEQIQGQLYRRYLDHIHDPEVRKLAHPGLVLRRITPQLILDVLAQPCGVEVKDLDAARKLYEELAREVSLVVQGPGELRHRSDVRRQMLATIRSDAPERARAIHEGAARFYKKVYEQSKEVRDLAEEIYHRLALGEPSEALERLWDEQAGPLLASAVDELPEASAIWLRSHLGLKISKAQLRRASLETWERTAVDRARTAIDRAEPERALEILRERSQRSGSSEIFRLEAEAHEALGDPAKAAQALARGVDHARLAGSVRNFIELSLAGARSLERVGRFARALAIADGCSGEVGSRATRMEALEIDVTRLHLRRLLDRGDDSETEAIREAVRRGFANLHSSELRTNPRIVRLVAAELGNELGVLARALKIVGVGPLAEDEARSLAAALDEWDHGGAREGPAARQPGEIAKAARVKESGGWISMLGKVAGAGLGQLLWDLSVRYGMSPAVVDALVHVYRTAVAPSSERSRRSSTRKTRTRRLQTRKA